MAESLHQILQQLKTKHEELQTEMNALRMRNRELEEINRDLKQKSDEALKLRDEAQQDVEFLKVSHRLADNPDSIVETRRLIAGLIKNIDRCIAMLKE